MSETTYQLIAIGLYFAAMVGIGLYAAGRTKDHADDMLAGRGLGSLTGMLLVAGVTLLYTLFGGFLGASLTDVVQGTMMFLALIIVPVIAFFVVGGLGEVQDAIGESGAELTGLFPADLTVAAVISIVSALAWGLGYVGQPHIIVRFMALRSVRSAASARRIGIGWMIISLTGAVLSGFIGIAYVQRETGGLDNPETVVLVMAQALLHPFVAGLVLAAVLAAIMSTISSQLIVCSSALVEDLFMALSSRRPTQGRMVLYGRLCVLVVGLIALVLAINPSDTILGLVAFAWAGFGAAFGPVILLSLFWRRLSNWGALSGMVVGAATVFLWDALRGWSDAAVFQLYEILPGFVLNIAVAVVVSRLTYRPDPEVEAEFSEAAAQVGAARARAETAPARR